MSRCLTISELSQKESPSLSKIFNLSFEYLLTGIAIEYCKIFKGNKVGFESIQAFNENNKLSTSLLISYPFFVAVSNGHAESLYALFGEFYATSYGPASLSVYDLIESSKTLSANPSLKYFNIGSKTNLQGIEIKNSISYTFNTIPDVFSEVRNSILMEDVILEFGQTLKYKDFFVRPDGITTKETPLFKAIDLGINAINSQSNGSFFDASERSILFHSKYFRAFLKGFQDSKEAVGYNEIESPKHRPFYAQEELP